MVFRLAWNLGWADDLACSRLACSRLATETLVELVDQLFVDCQRLRGHLALMFGDNGLGLDRAGLGLVVLCQTGLGWAS